MSAVGKATFKGKGRPEDGTRGRMRRWRRGRGRRTTRRRRTTRMTRKDPPGPKVLR